MILLCPNCSTACTIDEESLETVTCPQCGTLISSQKKPPSSQIGSGHDDSETVSVKNLDRESDQPDENGFLLPIKMDRYYIESLIASGGFASVYLAKDEKLGRRVALKMPRLEKLSTPQKMATFLKEAGTASKLRHPGIVTIFDVGQFSSGLPYIVMEYLENQTLTRLMATKTISISSAVDLVIKIANAVHYAHSNGLVHRDLKPGNILIDGLGEPRVVDFGLAVHETAQAYLRGEVSGTPPYMSPEQFRGEAHHLDGRTDIWSLGVIFYELLTGRRPFVGEAPQLRDEVLHKSPKPPRQIRDEIPPELEAICLKCLGRSVEDRYTTAKDLAEALNSWLQSSLSTSRRTEVESSSISGVQHQPAPTANLLWSTVAIVLATVGITMVFKPPAKENQVNLGAAVAPPNRPPVNQGQQVTPPPDPVPVAVIPLDDEPPLRAIPLIGNGRVPKKLSWPVPGVDDSFDCDLDEGRLTLHNRSLGMVELGSTHSKSVLLETELSQTGDRGMNGLFWGWQPDPVEPNQFSCFTAIINSVPKQQGVAKHRLIVQYLRLLAEGGGQHSILETAGLAGIDLDPNVHPQRGRLTVTINNDRGLQAVAWEGRVYDELSTQAHQFLASQPGRFPVMHCQGIFGVFNRQGAVLFRNPTVKIILKKDS